MERTPMSPKKYSPDQELLKPIFRHSEMMRRDIRQKKLLENEAALLNESLSETDKEAHRKLIESIQQQRLEWEKSTKPSYWKRLWRAILGK